MTSISVGIGNVRTNLKVAETTTNQPVKKVEQNQQEIKLRGITFRNDSPPPPQDISDITPLPNGSVPSDNELPDIFSDNSQNNIPQQQDYNQPQYTTTQPQQSSGNAEMSTGIGMAVGGVSGAILGKKFGFQKLGIAIGVAVGGFIGNKLGQ